MPDADLDWSLNDAVFSPSIAVPAAKSSSTATCPTASELGRHQIGADFTSRTMRRLARYAKQASVGHGSGAALKAQSGLAIALAFTGSN
jgi:hypothetical protein